MIRFGTDGVRGVANQDLTPEVVLALGRGIVRVLGTERQYLVGRDTRRSGTMLESALAAGMCAEGASVESAGPLPTPAIAWLAQERDYPAVVVTASHNPYPDNGIKVLARGGRKLTADEERAIERAADDALRSGAAADAPSGADVGTATRVAGAIDWYVVRALRTITEDLSGLRVVVDCANGATYGAAPRVLRELGVDLTVIHDAPNGTNINDHCGATDPSDLAATVKRMHAVAGFAFDGDGDRVIAVDATGAIVDGDALLGMHALDLLARGELPGNAVATTVMANLGLRRALAERGIGIIETPVGDRNILDALETGGLVLGGEQSGHLVFSDVAPTGDGIITAMQTLALMVRTGASLAELAAPFPRVPQELCSVPVGDPARLADATAVWDAVRAAQAELGPDGRVLVRASGTEPVVRVMVEHTDPARARAVTDEIVRSVETALA